MKQNYDPLISQDLKWLISLGRQARFIEIKFIRINLLGSTSKYQKLNCILLIILNEHLDHAIEMNKRSDNLYHAYNLLTIDKDKVKISHLPEMLEGQVAALSSGKIVLKQAVALLEALKKQ